MSSDFQIKNTKLPPHTTFLYPESDQYSFDKTCKNIIQIFEKKNWNVPGMQIRFIDPNFGTDKYRCVSEIKGVDFKLYFDMFSRSLNVSQIKIPFYDLRIYKDSINTVLYYYDGEDWEKDKEAFINEDKYDGKLEFSCTEKDEDVLRYDRPQGHLVNNNDDEKKYLSLDRKTNCFDKKQIFNEVDEWLKNNVLQKIENFESRGLEQTSEIEIPYPPNLGPFYLKIGYQDCRRILQGKEDKSRLDSSDRYALVGGGKELVDSDFTYDDSFPHDAYGEFTFCSLTKPHFLEVDPKEEDRDYAALLAIQPKNANGIFIADLAERRKDKRKSSEPNQDQDFLPIYHGLENDECIGRTLIPIHQYTGGFKDPVVLIKEGRELSFNEVDIIKKRDSFLLDSSDSSSEPSIELNEDDSSKESFEIEIVVETPLEKPTPKVAQYHISQLQNQFENCIIN